MVVFMDMAGDIGVMVEHRNLGVLESWSNRGLQVSGMRKSLALRFSGNCTQIFSRRTLGVLLFESRVLTLFFQLMKA